MSRAAPGRGLAPELVLAPEQAPELVLAQEQEPAQEQDPKLVLALEQMLALEQVLALVLALEPAQAQEWALALALVQAAKQCWFSMIHTNMSLPIIKHKKLELSLDKMPSRKQVASPTEATGSGRQGICFNGVGQASCTGSGPGSGWNGGSWALHSYKKATGIPQGQELALVLERERGQSGLTQNSGLAAQRAPAQGPQKLAWEPGWALEQGQSAPA